MKKNYNIEIDCANCANLMERAAGKIDGIRSASFNFMAQKVSIEFDEGADPDEIMRKVLKACKKIEPGCEIEF